MIAIHPTGGRSMSYARGSRSFPPAGRIARVSTMLLGLGVSTAFGQNNQFGNIHGIVTDSSGAPIPAAQVTVSSPALLATQTAASDSSGNYRFEQLPVGAYRIVAAQPGFQQ